MITGVQWELNSVYSYFPKTYQKVQIKVNNKTIYLWKDSMGSIDSTLGKCRSLSPKLLLQIAEELKQGHYTIIAY